MSYKRVVIQLVVLLVIAYALVSITHVFLAQPFVVTGNSMEPNFHAGDYLVIDELSYYLHTPARGDLVVFHYPLDPSIFFIKRVIGLPGDTLIVGQDGKVIISAKDGQVGLLSEPYILTANTPQATTTITLDKEEYFVLGDNREASFDSRVWGPVPGRYIIGRAVARLWPITQLSILPGHSPVVETDVASTTIHSAGAN